MASVCVAITGKDGGLLEVGVGCGSGIKGLIGTTKDNITAIQLKLSVRFQTAQLKAQLTLSYTSG
jgi:hypothetical protein